MDDVQEAVYLPIFQRLIISIALPTTQLYPLLTETMTQATPM